MGVKCTNHNQSLVKNFKLVTDSLAKDIDELRKKNNLLIDQLNQFQNFYNQNNNLNNYNQLQSNNQMNVVGGNNNQANTSNNKVIIDYKGKKYMVFIENLKKLSDIYDVLKEQIKDLPTKKKMVISNDGEIISDFNKNMNSLNINGTILLMSQ